MSSANKFALWLQFTGDPASNIQQRIRQLAEQYDAPDFEPHITLLGGLTDTNQAELIEHTNTLAESLYPLKLKMTTADYLDTFFQCLFIHVEQSMALMHAREHAERIFEKEPEEDYMPHISLLYSSIDRKEKERILTSLGREYQLSFRANRLSLVNTSGEVENWKIVHSADLSD